MNASNTTRQADSAEPDDSRDAILRLLDRPLDAATLREATERVAQPLSRGDRELSSLLVFCCGDERMGLYAREVLRVTDCVAVRRIPHRTNPIVRGLCNIEGELLICVDLQAVLGMPPSNVAAQSPEDRPSHPRMLVIGSEHANWVIQVDAVLGIRRIPGARLLPPPVTVQDDLQCFTRNLAPLGDDTLVSILDLEHLDSAFKAALS